MAQGGGLSYGIGALDPGIRAAPPPDCEIRNDGYKKAGDEWYEVVHAYILLS